MLSAAITLGERTGRIAPAALLGHNLELFDTATRDLLSDRLENPKFAGPANPATGIARGWQPPSANFMGIHYQLVAGEGIMGSEAELLCSTSNRGGKGLIQPHRWVREGELLEVTLWARAIHDPVVLRVGLRAASVWSADDVAAEIPVTSACWREYRATLRVPRSDDTAVFFCFLDQPGLAAIDQVHLRPAGGGVLREDVLRTLGAFDIPLLRFPGGCLTTAYHWQYGTWPAYQRPVHPDPVFKREISYELGTDEFLAFCTEHGITPVLTVNIGTGTPDEAAEWAAYCTAWYRARGMEPPLLYWQLGNEQYGYWERSHMSGEMYAEVIREMAPAIRAAYPAARIVALGMTEGDRLEQGRRPWRAPLLDVAGELIDVLALQLYAIMPPTNDVAQHVRVLKNAEWNARLLREAADDCRARGLPTRVALSEWNLWQHATHFAPEGFVEPMDIQHGIYAATMFHHFARLAPAMEFAAMYQLISAMCTFTITRAGITPTHMAEVFRFYRPAFPGELRALALDSPPLYAQDDELDMLDALVLVTSDTQWFFLLNRSADESVAVTVHGATMMDGLTLAGNTPQELQAITTPARITGRQIELPPLSMTRVRYH